MSQYSSDPERMDPAKLSIPQKVLTWEREKAETLALEKEEQKSSFGSDS